MCFRCIEIDVWNDDEKLFITHGHTLCSKIDLKDTLHAINIYAFENTDYPLIISVENHLDTKSQKKMAHMFRDVFGDRLVTGFLTDNEQRLPSPNQLIRRVILKMAKLNPNTFDNKKGLSTFDSIEQDDSDNDVTELDVFNKYDKKTQKYLFKIENMSQLYYCESPSSDRNENMFPLVTTQTTSYLQLSRLGSYTSIGIDRQNIATQYEPGDSSGDPNENEPWFIHNIDQAKSNEILKTYRECFETGTFLIRNSKNSKDYTLCVL